MLREFPGHELLKFTDKKRRVAAHHAQGINLLRTHLADVPREVGPADDKGWTVEPLIVLEGHLAAHCTTVRSGSRTSTVCRPFSGPQGLVTR